MTARSLVWAGWLAALTLALPLVAQAQYQYVQTPYGNQPVSYVQAMPVSGCSSGSCGSGCGVGCMPIIGPNTLTGWGGLWNWCNWKVAKANCCGPVGPCGTFVHCQPKPPAILFPRVCGKGVADICSMERFGYHNTCWAPWGYPPDYHHCPTPQLAAVVPPSYPKTQYFSPDPRLQQPGSNGLDDPKLEKEPVSTPGGIDNLPQPRRIDPRMQQ